MINKKVLLLSILFITILSVSVASAEENIDEIVSDSIDEIVLEDNADCINEINMGDEGSIDLEVQDFPLDEDLEVQDCPLDEKDGDLQNNAVKVSKDKNSLIQENNLEDGESLNLEDGENGLNLEDGENVLNPKSKNLLKSTSEGYVDPLTTYYRSGESVDFGWDDYFSGYFNVYRGDVLVHSEYLTGTDCDYEWCIDELDVGTYIAKLIDDEYGVIDWAEIEILKVVTKTYVKSFVTTVGTWFYCYAYVTDDINGWNINGGYVKFYIAGKTYWVAVKNGVAVKSFKIPKKAKRYVCRATYLGTSNVKSSTTKFKMVVKKKKVKKTVKRKVKVKKIKAKKVKRKKKIKKKYKKKVKRYRVRRYRVVRYRVVRVYR